MPAGYAGRLNGLYSRKWNRVTKNKKDSELMMLRFLSGHLFATIAITLASGFPPPGTSLANEMEATHPLV
jgi:hypothetical protein